MAPTEDEKYQPKDAVHIGLYNGMAYGGVGLFIAAVKNSLARQNVGPWNTFTKHGHIIAIFAAAGGSFEFTRAASANLREKDDHWNDGIAGFVAGAIIGLRSGRFPRIVGWSTMTAAAAATYAYAGGSLVGYLKPTGEEEYERKEKLRLNRRRPVEETLAEIGEGRGIKPPGYEERRRQRIKEKYGIDINPVCADPDAA
ncbi:hypothetical protein VTJ49DRAFT_875 [Mycothermus thermophilus]|uniref:Uncharacterized protein n=1 Tax=Humicola insolens TaxID=85995 RepID=A0ABR3VP96_HUMIN